MAKRNKGIIINIASDLGILTNQEVYHPSENIKKVKNLNLLDIQYKTWNTGNYKIFSTYWAIEI